jgi:hypothetical protein
MSPVAWRVKRSAFPDAEADLDEFGVSRVQAAIGVRPRVSGKLPGNKAAKFRAWSSIPPSGGDRIYNLNATKVERTYIANENTA